ncbi:hypothetical protein pb186bvf_002535 [Paramecium bursaria]
MTENFQACVIGAGPAGIISVCKLLERNIYPILWVDPKFDCGGLVYYQDIPSNTKVRIQIDVVNGLGWIQQYRQECDPAQAFDGLNPEETSPLGNSYKMFAMIQNILDQNTKNKVIKIKTVVEKIRFNGQKHEITLGDQQQFQSKYIFVCTGSQRNTYHSVQEDLFEEFENLEEIDLFKAMSSNECSNHYNENDTIAVFGNSHSGMLACMNFFLNNKRPKKVVIYSRRPIIFAEYLPDGKIANDSTGLKGKVAEWTKKLLQTHPDLPIEFIQCENNEYKQTLKNCTKVVIATGFQRIRLPKIELDGQLLLDQRIGYNEESNKIVYGQQEIKNMFGFGIAFPQKVLDVTGTYQLSVGFFKFLKTITKTINELE